MSKLNPE